MTRTRRSPRNLAAIVIISMAFFLNLRHAYAAPSLSPIPTLLSKPATQNTEPAASAGPAQTDEVVAPDSPRASVEAYLGLCKQGRYQDAAKYLSVAPSQAGRAAELAQRLKAVLDSDFWIDVETLSSASEGATNDLLPPGHEQIGQIIGANGKAAPLRLTRRVVPGAETRWVFSRVTVDQIDDWYDHLEQRWFLDHMPKYLLKVGPRDLMIWQWIGLPILFAVSWGFGYLLSRVSRSILARAVKRTPPTWDDEFVGRLGGPLTLTWLLALVYVLLPWLGLYEPVENFVKSSLQGGLFFCLFWAISRLFDVWGKAITTSEWGREHSASHSLVPLGVRVGKIAVLVIAIVALVSAFGYPAASLIAGLGVGGLALALAAQKTVENLFGAFSIGADQPFREGDFIKVDDVTGTVESLGLRSTRIRTLDRTVISMPNGKLSEMRIESYTARDRMRLSCIIGLVYDTTADQMRQVLHDLEQVLSSHPKIWSESITVRFKEFGASSLNIEVMAWFLTSDYTEFQEIRQDVLLSFMECVKNAGSAFAFPTQTVYLQGADNSKV